MDPVISVLAVWFGAWAVLAALACLWGGFARKDADDTFSVVMFLATWPVLLAAGTIVVPLWALYRIGQWFALAAAKGERV